MHVIHQQNLSLQWICKLDHKHNIKRPLTQSGITIMATLFNSDNNSAYRNATYSYRSSGPAPMKSLSSMSPQSSRDPVWPFSKGVTTPTTTFSPPSSLITNHPPLARLSEEDIIKLLLDPNTIPHRINGISETSYEHIKDIMETEMERAPLSYDVTSQTITINAWPSAVHELTTAFFETIHQGIEDWLTEILPNVEVVTIGGESHDLYDSQVCISGARSWMVALKFLFQGLPLGHIPTSPLKLATVRTTRSY